MHDRLSGCHEMQGIVSKCQQHFFQILVSCKHLHKDQRVAFAGLVIIHLSRRVGPLQRGYCVHPQNLEPGLKPFLLVLITIGDRQSGQYGPVGATGCCDSERKGGQNCGLAVLLCTCPTARKPPNTLCDVGTAACAGVGTAGMLCVLSKSRDGWIFAVGECISCGIGILAFQTKPPPKLPLLESRGNFPIVGFWSPRRRWGMNSLTSVLSRTSTKTVFFLHASRNAFHQSWRFSEKLFKTWLRTSIKGASLFRTSKSLKVFTTLCKSLHNSWLAISSKLAGECLYRLYRCSSKSRTQKKQNALNPQPVSNWAFPRERLSAGFFQ